jgi:hypothetical protein
MVGEVESRGYGEGIAAGSAPAGGCFVFGGAGNVSVKTQF